MKKITFYAIALSLVAFAACNDQAESKSAYTKDTVKPSTETHATTDDKDIKAVSVTYTNVDSKIATSVKEIVDHYLHVKNALVNGNESEAATGGKAIEAALGKIDKSLFTTEQKAAYDEVADDLKEHAEHIGKSKIDHQREHFATMSEDLYALAKAFGGGRTLYHDHCPMYNNNKGAMWLSESKEVKNPYYGNEMLTCGKVQEVINN